MRGRSVPRSWREWPRGWRRRNVRRLEGQAESQALSQARRSGDGTSDAGVSCECVVATSCTGRGGVGPALVDEAGSADTVQSLAGGAWTGGVAAGLGDTERKDCCGAWRDLRSVGDGADRSEIGWSGRGGRDGSADGGQCARDRGRDGEGDVGTAGSGAARAPVGDGDALDLGRVCGFGVAGSAARCAGLAQRSGAGGGFEGGGAVLGCRGGAEGLWQELRCEFAGGSGVCRGDEPDGGGRGVAGGAAAGGFCRTSEGRGKGGAVA